MEVLEMTLSIQKQYFYAEVSARGVYSLIYIFRL